jgi:mono/diheme cytochrome c family protein
MYKPWYSFLYIKSPIAKILWGIAALVITLVVVGFQTVIEEPRMAAQNANWEGRAIEKGADIYNNNCYTCHGTQGQGAPNVAPPLNSKHFFEKRITEIGFSGSLRNYIKGVVAAGRPVKSRPEWAQVMPTWGQRYGGPLRDDQVEQVTAYVLNWEKTALQQTDAEDPWQSVMGVSAVAAPTGPQTPQQIFTSKGCIGCHAIKPEDEGKVMVGPYLGKLNEVAPTRKPDMKAEDYVYESIVNPSAFNVPDFPSGVMPANFKDTISEEDLQKLVAWLLDPNRTY